MTRLFGYLRCESCNERYADTIYNGGSIDKVYGLCDSCQRNKKGEDSK